MAYLISERLRPPHQEEAIAWFWRRARRNFDSDKPLDVREKNKEYQKRYREHWYEVGRKYGSLRVRLAGWYAEQPARWQRSPVGQEFRQFLADPQWQLQTKQE